jgi:hypothetical protein
MDHTPVHHNGPHANEYIVMDGTSMHHGVVPNRYIVANGGGVLLVSAVYDCAVLHVYAVAHFNKMHIASYHGVKPKTTFFTCANITNNGCVGCYKAVFSKTG